MTDDNPNIADTPAQDPRAQYDEIDEKAILIDIAAQLDAIRRLLEHQHTEPSTPSVAQLRCTVCDTTIPEPEKKEHARNCFGWSSAIGEDALSSRYERIQQ